LVESVDNPSASINKTLRLRKQRFSYVHHGQVVCAGAVLRLTPGLES
jgi:hypothetical protein